MFGLDFSLSGLWAGIVHGLKVMLYVAVSAAVVSAIGSLGSLQVTPGDYLVLALVTIANGVLAAAEKWLTTHPDFEG